jgi:succinyl-CoA synthetase beta subunit
MVALSESFVADEALQEIEINPLLVRAAGHGVVALDAVATTRIEG